MNRREFLGTAAGAVLATMAGGNPRFSPAPASAQPVNPRQRPNIVLILADDLGYGDLSCLNPDSKIQTPYHDRVAREGMTFTDAHSNCAICTPTRYGVLTGRYSWRSRLKTGVLWGYSPLLIENGRDTVASLLKRSGYATACIGKWHLGIGWQTPPDVPAPVDEQPEDPGVYFDRPLTTGPHTVGFDYSLIIPASLDMAPYCFIENGHVTEPNMRMTDDSPRSRLWRPGKISEGFEHETCLLQLTRRAESWIAEQAARQSEQPFFLYFPTTSPHTPHVPRSSFVGRTNAGVYGDFMTEHDWSIGRILAALDRNGLADNTMVIITSDNGAPNMQLEREFGHRSSYIYSGFKTDIWDGGHRIPLLVRWPGRVQAGSTCDRPVCLTDLLATCAAAAGAPVPGDVTEDGVSLLPYLEGNMDHQPPRQAIVHDSGGGLFAIRTERWKLLLCRGSGGRTLREKDAPEMPHQLYDMREDPSEKRNVAAEHPEIVQELTKLLETYQQGDRSTVRPS